MSDKEQLKMTLEKLDLEGRFDEVLNKTNKFGPTTKMDGNKLVWLDLSDMGIDEIPSDAFEGLENLEELKLFRNDIKHLPKDVFDPVPELSELHLKDNDIQEITPRHFERLDKLERLFLLGNDALGSMAKVYPNKMAVETFLDTLEKMQN